MHAPVDARDHDRIDFSHELFDRSDQLDLPLVAEFGGEFLDSRGARLDIGTATLEGRDNARARNVIGPRGIVEELGESAGVRGVEADQPDADRPGIGGCALLRVPGAKSDNGGQDRGRSQGRCGCGSNCQHAHVDLQSSQTVRRGSSGFKCIVRS